MSSYAVSNADLAQSATGRPSKAFESLMLAEHTHRIANDLAMMMAELEICRVRLTDVVAARVVAGALARLRDVHGVQRCLLQPIEGEVDLALTISNLAAAVVRARGSAVHLVLNLTPMIVDARMSWRIATIVNELLTNALKYGSGSERCGRVEVSLDVDEDRVICVVADNGSGAGDWSPKGTGHGFGIIGAIAAQLGGDVERSTSGCGTRIGVAIPRRPEIDTPPKRREPCGPRPHYGG